MAGLQPLNTNLKPFEPYVPYDQIYNPTDLTPFKAYKPYASGDLWDPNYKPFFPSNPKPNYVANYNDPHQINSMADAVLTTFDPDMKRKKFFGLEKIPLLNIVTSTIGDLMWDKEIRPMLDWDGTKNFLKHPGWDTFLQTGGAAAGINALINIGETLDVLANPVKAAIMNPGNRGQVALDAMGWGGHGRKNFDYNTGSFIGDLGAEMISDPLNWFTLFGKAIIGAPLKAVTKTAIKEAAGEIGEKMAKELGEDAANQVYKKLAKEAVNSYLVGDTEGMVKRMTNIATHMTEKGLLNFNRMPVPEDFIGMMDKIVDAAKTNMSSTVIKAAQSIIKPTEALQNVLFKGSMASTGITPAWWTANKARTWISEFVTNKHMNTLNEFVRPDGNLSFVDFSNSKQAFDQGIDDLKMATKMGDNELMTPEMHTIFMRESVESDENFINNMFRKFGDDPEEFDKRVNTYFREFRGVDSIDDYLDTIKVVNEQTDNAFLAEQRVFEELVDRMRRARELAIFKNADEQLGTAETMLQKITDNLKQKLHDGIFKNVRETYFEDNNYAAMDYSNFKTHMESVIDQIEHSKGYSAQSVHEDLTTAFNEYLHDYMDDFIGQYEDVLSRVQPNTLLFRWSQDMWNETMDVVNQWARDMRHQIDVYARRVEKTGNLYKNPERKLSWFNYQKVHPIKQLDRIIDDNHMLIERYRKIANLAEANYSSVYQHFEDFFAKTGRVQRLVNKLTDSSKAQLIKKFKKTPIDAKQVVKLQNDLRILYDKDMAHLMENAKEILNISPDYFREVFENFLNFKGTNMYEYWAAYDKLKNLLSQIPVDQYRNKIGMATAAKIGKDLKDVPKQFEDAIVETAASKLVPAGSSEAKQLFPTMQKIMDKLEELNPFMIEYENLEVKADSTFVQLKMEQLYSNYLVMQNETLNEFIDSINSNTGLGAFIKQQANITLKDGIDENAKRLLSGANELANNILEAASNYNNYFQFLEKLYQAPMQEESRLVFLSTLQKYATDDPMMFYTNLDSILPKIYKSMDDYMYSTQMKESLSLEKLIEELNIKIEGSMHTADVDIKELEEVIKHKLADEFSDTGINYVIADIETTQVGYNAGSVLEIAFKTFGQDDTTTLRRMIDKTNKVDVPQSRLLNKFFPKMDERTQLAEYYKRYSEGYDEKELLQKFTEQVAQLPPNTILVFHNGDQFDIDFIINRMKQNQVNPRAFEKITKWDTLEMMKKKAGYKVVSENDKKAIKSVLSNYANRMVGKPKLIDPSNGSLAKSFKDLSRVLEEAAYKNVNGFKVAADQSLAQISLEFSHLGNVIYDQFQFISQTNKAFKTSFFDKGWLTGDEGLKIFTDYLQETLGLTKEQVAERFGKYLNTSKLFYAITDGANYIGYKNIIDMDKILEYFTFKQGDKIDYRLAKGLTSLARGFDNAYNGIKNPWILQPMAVDIQKMLRELIPSNFAEQMRAFNKLIENKGLTDYSKLYTYLKNKGFDQIVDPAERIALLRDAVKTYGFTNLADVTEKLQIIKALETHYFQNVKINTKIDTFFSYIRSDKADVMSNWVMLQYLFKQYDKQNLLTPEFKAQFNQGLINLLEDPGAIRSYTKSGMEMSYIEASSKMLDKDGEIIQKTVNKKLVDMAARREIIDEFHNTTTKSFKDWAQSMDDYDMYRAKTQALGAALERVENMLQTFANKIDNAPSFEHKQKIYKATQDVTEELAEQQFRVDLERLSTGDIAELQAHMAHRAPWIEFDTADLLTGDYKQTIAKIIEREKDFEAFDIGVHTEGTRMYIFLKNSADLKAEYGTVTIRGNIVTAPELKELKVEEAFRKVNDPEFAEALQQTRNTIQELSEFQATGSLGDVVDTHFYAKLYDQLPKKVQDAILTKDKILNPELFKDFRFNHTNIGSLASRRMKQEFMPSTIIDIFRHSAENTALYAKTRIQYAQLYYDKSFSINNGWLKTASDTEIMRAFQESPEFILTALVEDTTRKHGYKVIEIKPTSVESINQARRLNAVVMPYQTFSKAFETINQGKIESMALQLIHKLVYTYKIGYLLDPGVWLRNFADSSMKTMIETKTVLGAATAGVQAEMMLKQYDEIIKGVITYDQAVKSMMKDNPEMYIETAKQTAMKLINEHGSALDDILRMDVNGRITEENIEYYFSHINKKLDKDLFQFTHAYIFDGPSAGLTSELEKYFLDAPDGAWATFVHLSNKMMTPNKKIEQVNRLAQYIIEAERGTTTTEAFYKIAKTHFDYAIKSDWEKMVEIVFPFYTFTMKNIEYWVNAMMNYPWLPPLFRDIMTPIWNFDGIDQKELNSNRSLQYQILAGNIPLNDKGLTLKVSPSWTDVFNIMTNPIQNIESKMFQPLQTILGTGSGSSSGIFGSNSDESKSGDIGKTIMMNLPVVGAMYQRYAQTGPKYYDRTGSMLNLIAPGIFGGTLRYGEQQPHYRKPLVKFQPRTGYYRRPRKVRKAWKTYPRRSYAKKTYFKQAWQPKQFPHLNYYNRLRLPQDSIYKSLYTQYGQSRWALKLKPVTGKTLQYKIKQMKADWNYTR